MPREINSNTLVALPNVTAAELYTLALSLETAAIDEKTKKPRKLTDPIQAALDDVKEQRIKLGEVLGTVPNEAKVRTVDILEDRAVGAFRDLLAAWARLAEVLELGEVAARLLQRLFPDGIDFILLTPAAEFAEVDHRLETIKREKLDADIESLGAAPMLAYLREVHEEYGKVTGARAPLPERESPQVLALKRELADVVRQYVVAVSGSIIRKQPATRTLADLLLQPLLQWESPSPARKKGGDASTNG
jgi:hypothetical protein